MFKKLFIIISYENRTNNTSDNLFIILKYKTKIIYIKSMKRWLPHEMKKSLLEVKYA